MGKFRPTPLHIEIFSYSLFDFTKNFALCVNPPGISPLSPFFHQKLNFFQKSSEKGEISPFSPISLFVLLECIII